MAAGASLPPFHKTESDYSAIPAKPYSPEFYPMTQKQSQETITAHVLATVTIPTDAIPSPAAGAELFVKAANKFLQNHSHAASIESIASIERTTTNNSDNALDRAIAPIATRQIWGNDGKIQSEKSTIINDLEDHSTAPIEVLISNSPAGPWHVLGAFPDPVCAEKISKLWKLGFLDISIESLPLASRLRRVA